MQTTTKHPNYEHISVKIVEDSIFRDDRLTTFELTYPRYVHAELMTHRVFSRNAQSSRAIPADRRIENVVNRPVFPIEWGLNQRGMQAKDTELSGDDLVKAQAIWHGAAADAAAAALKLKALGLHKQWINRLLEPFDTITVIVTSTQWTNFFGLRCHKDALPEFQEVAWRMAHAYHECVPNRCNWHLPYVTEEETADVDECNEDEALEFWLRVSTARCARVSYLNHDGSLPKTTDDLKLYDRLLSSKHMSSFEHPAYAGDFRTVVSNFGDSYWIQHRKDVRPDTVEFDYPSAVTEQGLWL